jgi:glycosyltransferase involved in cell wall biosynthesis
VRILQVTAFYPPSLGGVQFYVQRLSQSLVRRGHEIDVLTVNTEDARSYERCSDTTNVIRCHLDASYHRGLVSTELCRRLISAKSHDLYHVHVPFPLGVEMTVLASRRNSTPLVATHHGQGIRGDPLYALAAGSYSLFSRAVSFRGLDRLVFLTQSYADSLWLPRPVRQQVVIVPTGADVSRFSPAQDGSEVREQYGLGPEAPLVLFVGSLRAGNGYKGVDHLIRAVPAIRRLSPGARVMIVGGGGLLPKLKEQTRQMTLDSTVVFTGAIDNARLPQYYAASDLLVLPSVPGGSENSPLVLFEAMASGKPAVASRLPGVCEIVQDGETGLLVPPAEPDEIAAAVARLLNDDGFRLAAGRRARAAAERYSWDDCARRMEAIYRELIDQ